MLDLDYQKICEALLTISDACDKIQEYGGCKCCPMGDNDGICLVKDCSPYNWNITEPREVIRVMQ